MPFIISVLRHIRFIGSPASNERSYALRWRRLLYSLVQTCALRRNVTAYLDNEFLTVAIASARFVTRPSVVRRTAEHAAPPGLTGVPRRSEQLEGHRYAAWDPRVLAGGVSETQTSRLAECIRLVPA
jgi:hypothetical protein